MKTIKEKIQTENLDREEKITDISDTFGMLSGTRKMSGQKFKDLARKVWD